MEPTNQPQEEEVRLIELLATAIRHRRWIYGFMGLGIATALIFIWLLPLFGITLLNPPTYSVQATLRVASVPETVRSYVADDLAALAVSQVTDLGLVGQIYEATLATDKDKVLDRPGYNRVIKSFIKKDLKATIDPSKVLIFYILKTRAGQQQQALAFLTRFIAEVESSQRSAVLPAIRAGLAAIEGSASKSLELSSNALSVTKTTLQSLVNDSGFPFVTVGSVELVEDDPLFSNSVLTVLLVLAGLVVGFFAAFVAETMVRTRQNPEDMKLLSGAWSRTKEG